MDITSLPTRPVLTLTAAQAMLDAALDQAARDGLDSLVITIVDEGGRPILLLRQDGAEPGAVEISLGKARTAALFRKPSKAWRDRLEGGATWVLSLADVQPMEGGHPIIVQGQVIGAIGVAGAASGPQDSEVCVVALQLFEPA